MPIGPSNGRSRRARFLVPILIAALAPAGCGSDAQSGDLTPTSKDAPKRQKEMFDFMKDRTNVKPASKPTPRNHP